jgi:hypothetical protein
MLKQARWLDAHIPDLTGQSFLVTGSTSGVGLEAAKSLLYKGGSVDFAIRNPEKAEKIFQALQSEIPNAKPRALLYDQGSPESVLQFCQTLNPQKPYDAIILNAGIYYPRKGSQAEDGTSLTFETNAVGTYLLYMKLREKFPKARFILVASIVNRSPKKGDYSSYLLHGGNRRAEEYSVSKRAIMNLFGYGLTHTDDALYMTHPGVTGSAIFDGFPPLIRKLGHKLLYLVVHHPWKACLGEVYLAAVPCPRGSVAAPRGPFQISGYPHLVQPNKKKVFRDAEALHLALYRVYHV